MIWHIFFLSAFDRKIPGVTRFAYNLYENVVKSNEDLFKHLKVFLDGKEGFAEGKSWE